eukprot:3529057-Rhodomonas_salina.1
MEALLPFFCAAIYGCHGGGANVHSWPQKTELIRRLVRLFYPYALTNPWGYGSVLNFGTKSILGFVVWQTLPLQ